MEIKIGQTFEREMVVEQAQTAEALGSGTLAVFATPAMIALMENCAFRAVGNFLPLGSTTVGTEISAQHLKALKVGATVRARAEVVAVDGRKIEFEILVFDASGAVVGTARHTRFVVDESKFLSKLN